MKTILIFIQLFLLVSIAFAQKTITGKVTDNRKQPLANVSITGKISKIAVNSSKDGTYKISVPQNEKVLIFNLEGYGRKELLINASVVNCILVPVENKSKLRRPAIVDEISAKDGPAVEGEILVYESFSIQGAKSASGMGRTNTTYYNPSTEEYNKVHENGFKNVKSDPLSTFSIDVDRASYSNIRRFLNLGQMVPADAVRIEEMINYFNYDYPQPTNQHPYSINAEYTECPWQSSHYLLHIGLQGKKIPTDNLPPSNIVFLLDVSGSMDEANKLPLVKSGIKLLVNNLREKDKISIVVYAGAAGIVLNSTPGNDKAKILEAIDNLQAGGSTAGGEGILLAYKTAEENFLKGGNNRIILCTDGDFNVGVSNQNELEDLIVKKRESGVFLTCLGFGMGNYKDNKIETLANKGNGNYAYIDNIQEANKTLVSEFGSTIFTIAKDVKLQVEFNPSVVQAYRLVGYENRMLNTEDFKDDKKDAGEMGAGHTVTAIYEIIPVGVKSEFIKEVDNLKYQTNQNELKDTKEVATIKTRYKLPDGNTGIDYNIPVANTIIENIKASENSRFSSAVAMFGMLLRNSEFKGTAGYEQVISQAENARGTDSDGYRAEFIRLVKTAKELKFSSTD
ncbi:MAG: von Willebrand factor type A domain-containing protein [Bacteroidales bacterium]